MKKIFQKQHKVNGLRSILEKNYNIFYASLPVSIRKVVILCKKHKIWEPFIMKLEKLGEENAIKTCPENYGFTPRPRPGDFNPENYPELCKYLVNAIVKIIRKFKK